MLSVFIIMGVIIGIIIFIGMSASLRLTAMEDRLDNAMNQIGIQISSRFDALTALLDLSKRYAVHESEMLIETIKSGRSVITVDSTPQEVLRQEEIISEVLDGLQMIREQYPALQANARYQKYLDAADTFENMVRTSKLVYNDGVTTINRELHTFPVFIFAGILGYSQKEYLEEK